MSLHGYICMCRLKSCRRRIYLLPSEYRVLIQIGMLLSAECAARESRAVITGYNGYRVVAAANRGKSVLTTTGGRDGSATIAP